MKNKWLLIVLGVVVILTGAYFLTRDDANVPEDVGDNGQEAEQPQEPEEPVDSENPEEPADPETPEDSEFVEGEDIAVGKPAPIFKYENKDGEEVVLTNLDGKEVSLEDYRGKIILLNFWGTWCKWCDVEMPDLDKLDRENDDLVVLAVNVDEDKETVQDYIDKGGYDFEVVLDTEGQIAKKYLISAFPTSYFLDKEGVLLGGVPGMMEYEQMEEVLEAVRGNIEE